MSFKGLHGVIRGYKRLRWVSRRHRELQRLQGFTGSYRVLQGVARG